MFAPALRVATRSLSTSRPSVVRASTRFATSPFVARSAGPNALPKRYTEDHEAVEYDDETGISKVFITDYAQKALGDVVFVELPQVGEEIEAGGDIGAVESVKAASDVYAPLSGVVESVNTALADQPSLLNKSPEKDGWLLTIKVSKPEELDDLLTAEAYKAHCEQ